MFVRRLALAIGLAAGLIGSQGPEFAQQYRQRLGGALSELRRIVAEFDAEAAHESLTPAQAIDRLKHNPDALAQERGRAMTETIDRARKLEDQLAAMSEAGPLKRLYVTVREFDPKLARNTLDAYEPAAPLTVEALVAAGLAAIWGWAATHLICWPFGQARRARAEARA